MYSSLGARIYDLVSVRELPSGPAVPSLHQSRTDSSIRLIFFRNRLHLVGRPQRSTIDRGGGIERTIYADVDAETSTKLARQLL
jgi:hypothetical protein